MNRAQKRRQQKLARKAAKKDRQGTLLQKGLRAHQAGQWPEAEAAYRRVLDAEPNHPDANHLLGMIAYQAGDNELAVQLISKAIGEDPLMADFHCNLGNALKRLGRLDEALESHRKALGINPDLAEAHANMGNALKELGRLEDAVASYRKALAIKPDLAEVHSNLGVAQEEQGRLDEALASHRNALHINPDYAEAHSNLGNALKEMGRLEDAVASHRKALAINPGLAKAHNNLGIALEEQGRLEDAAASYRQALAIDPDYAAAHANLGHALQDRGLWEDAMTSTREALGLDPDNAELHCHLGIALEERGLSDEAAASYLKALEIDPEYAEAHSNLGKTLQGQGLLEDAAARYRKALAIKPDLAEAHTNLGLLLLMMGSFEDGWREYAWRWRKEETEKERKFPQAPWQGEDVNDKTILVWAEQGVGDEIMHAGMVPDLLDAGAEVVLECQRRLVALFQRSFPGVECLVKQDPPVPETLREDIDFQAPAGGLGRWLRPGFASFPARPSYLIADEGRTAALREKYLGGGNHTLVGVAWSSKVRKMGAKKSMSLMDLRPLTGCPGVKLIDLQYGETGEERDAFERAAGTPLLHDQDIDSLKDLDAFASQVAAMDLVISVSNTTVHMAGALGVPAWAMLGTASMMCWFLDRQDSPWYPSVRLFRQEKQGDWQGVVERVARALGDRV